MIGLLSVKVVGLHAGSTPFEMSFTIVGEKGTIRLSETGYKIIYEDGVIEIPSPAKEGFAYRVACGNRLYVELYPTK